MKFSLLALIIALVGALLLLAAGPGTRLEIWDFGFGFTLMRWALYLGAGAAVLAVILALIPRTRRGSLATLAGALLIGLATAAVPLLLVQQARSVPPIHDISTDTVDPPAFVAIAPLREDAPNPLDYPGQETAEAQREAYPDLATFRTDLYPAIVFDHALASAENLGWEIVAAEADEGRIEATDTTFWFGFKDDIVIRIQAVGDGSQLDIRSKSRVGQSDVGANAARIRRFIDRLDERVH